MSSDEEVVGVRKKKIVSLVADSSDENEISKDQKDVGLEANDSEELSGSNEVEKKFKKKKRRIKTFNSSSESESESNFEKLKNQKEDFKKHVKPKKDKKNISMERLNSENNDSKDESSDEEIELNRSEEQINEESSNLGTKTKNLWYTNTDLYDAEGSSEEEDKRKETNSESNKEDNSSSDEPISSNSKRKLQKIPIKREERKSKKKAQEDIKTEIYKESQRLMRQGPVSIPYHRPKQRSLAEFLVRKKSIPKVSLRTSSEQLITALREIEQREKEAELFYKSESSEEEIYENKKRDQVENNCKDVVELNKKGDLNDENSKGGIQVDNIEEDKSRTNSDDEFSGNSNAVEKAKRALFDDTETDSVLEKENHEGSNFQLEETVKSGSDDNNAENCSQKISLITEKPMLLSVENIEKSENSLMPKTESVNINTSLDKNMADDELSNTNSAKLLEAVESTMSNTSTLESLEKSSDDKITNVEDIYLLSNIGKNQNVRQLQSNTNNIVSSKTDINKTIDSCNSSGLINTEEFSLKLSESQSEYESIESTKDDSDIKSNKDNVANEINTNLRTIGTLNDNLNQGDKNCDLNLQNDKKELESEESVKVGQSYKERDFENELYRKYNVDLKTTTTMPKISGSHDEVIDLCEGVPKPEVNQLMKRFLTHLSYKKKPAKKMAVELSVTAAERDGDGRVSGITHESLQVLLGAEEEDEDPSLARPGAKLSRLRAQLQSQMERQRDLEWAKRQQEHRLYEDEQVYEGEKDVCDGIDEDAEEYENEKKEDTEEEEEEEDVEDEEESENEEDESDEELAEKKRKSRSVFLDDEAEESDEEPYIRKSCTNKDKKYDDDCNESTGDADYHDEENNIDKIEDIKETSPKKESEKGPKDICDFFLKRPAQKKPFLPRTRTTSDIFSSQEVFKHSPDDEEIPSFQKPRSLEDKEDFEEKLSEPPSIVSPAFQLTALENMDGANKYNWSEPSTPCKDFFSPKTITPVRAIPNLVDKSPQVCTQDLENLCSGGFSSQPLPQTQLEDNAQDFELFLAEDSQLERDHVTPVKSSATRKSNSDDEEQKEDLYDEDELPAKNPPKKAKKLKFSDDEDEGEDTEREEEPVENNSEASDVEGSEKGEVEYDSEENEVEVAAAKAGEFLDVEAELSEEEWSSEDEDERGLDTLEMEEADRERINQRRLQRELGQIHMKEMLKEDKKQVKLLQELLLEDGELHSDSKRQRLFRWSNNTAFNEGDSKAVLDSDEEKAEEDEDEEAWRKTRHEREVYLQENSKKLEKLESLELEESDSQLLRLGQKALRRLSSGSQQPRLTPPTLSNPLASPDAKKPFPLPKRGSFLSRGQQTLSRLAQMVSSGSDAPIQQPKNSRNFVFASISPTKAEQEEAKPVLVPNKRRLPHLPLPIAKKPCVQKSKTANKRSIFEALTKVQS